MLHRRGSRRQSLQMVKLSQQFWQAANCVETSRPQQWGSALSVLGNPHMRAAPHKGGSCRDKSMSDNNTQTKPGFVISAINKYMVGSQYQLGATGLNTVCT